MSLKGLIKDKIIVIDPYNQINRKVLSSDRESNNIHINLQTKYQKKNQGQIVKIIVPVNSDMPIIIRNRKRKPVEDIPVQLTKCIVEAFANKQGRTKFIGDLVNIIKKYDNILEEPQRFLEALDILSRHFQLGNSMENGTEQTNGILQSYIKIFKEVDGRRFYIMLTKNRIVIGDYGKDDSLEDAL